MSRPTDAQAIERLTLALEQLTSAVSDLHGYIVDLPGGRSIDTSLAGVSIDEASEIVARLCQDLGI